MSADDQRSQQSSSGGADIPQGAAASGPAGSSPSSRTSPKKPKFDFFQKRRSVAPLILASEPTINGGSGDGSDDGSDDDTNSHTNSTSRITPHEPLLFLNRTPEFDFRSFFRRTVSVSDAAPPPQHTNKRRLRAREELCFMAAKTHGRAKRAWFLCPGFIGRDSNERTLVCTKDTSMDAVHAEVLVDGDDYLVRDCGSVSGTYLCLSTTNRHHPQRDGFRLRNNDVFLLGRSTRITVHDLCVTPLIESDRGNRDSCAKTTTPSNQPLQEELARCSSNASADSHKDNINDDGSSNRTTEDTKCDDNTRTTQHRVRFGDARDIIDGSVAVGNRYKRQTKRSRTKRRASAYTPMAPVSLTVTITVDDVAVVTDLQLPGKRTYLIGSSPVCDLCIPNATSGAAATASDIHGVHARIVFDGCFFVLQDLSFEENPRHKTRVSLAAATRLARGDVLLLGTFVLFVVNVYRAFPDYEPDMKEVAFQCHVLRPSKRKARAKHKYIPFGFRHHALDPFVVGKGRHCEGHIFSAALNLEQFAIQLDHGTCSLVARAAGINQGVYFLLGRDCMPHESAYRPDLVRSTSKALMLVEGSVFKCGNTEIEVVYVKNERHAAVAAAAAADAATQRAEELQATVALLANLPWLAQITYDRHGLENVAKRAQRLTLDVGDTIYDDGDPATFVFVVVRGEVELSVSHHEHLHHPPSHRNSTSNSHQDDMAPTNSWRLSAVDSFAKPAHDDDTSDSDNDTLSSLAPSLSGATLPSAGIDAATDATTSLVSATSSLIEHVTNGSYFGEVCLCGAGLEYRESAKATTPCELLALSRDDICGYFALYMDIITPHLAYEHHREVLYALRLHVAWLHDCSFQDLRVIASKAACVRYDVGDAIVTDGVFQIHHAPRRGGLLLLTSGNAMSTLTSASSSSRAAAATDDDVDVDALRTQHELWHASDPIACSNALALDARFANVQARSRVECFYVDVRYVEYWIQRARDGISGPRTQGRTQSRLSAAGRNSLLPLHRMSTTNRRRSSYVATHQRVRHSQVVLPASVAALVAGLDDADDVPSDGESNGAYDSDSSDANNDPSQRWRRKKRNKLLLERTIVATQQSDDVTHALVLYVLAGANRGDIHVVRHVATLGALLSDADIVLNDQLVSPLQAVIQHRDGHYWLYDTASAWGTFVRLEENQTIQVHPGDVFHAGEVEFTCLAAFPVRKKTQICCVQ